MVLKIETIIKLKKLFRVPIWPLAITKAKATFFSRYLIVRLLLDITKLFIFFIFFKRLKEIISLNIFQNNLRLACNLKCLLLKNIQFITI